MKEEGISLFMIGIDDDLVTDLWEAICEYDIEDIPKLRLEIWTDKERGKLVLDMFKEGQENPYYDEEPDDLVTMWADSSFLNLKFPRLGLFTYFYRAADYIVEKKERENG